MLRLQVLLPALTVVVVFLVRIVELGTKRDLVPGPVKENVSLRLFILTGVIMLISTLAELFAFERRLYWPTYLLGAVMALTSFVIRRRAIAALGRFWSLHVEIREQHVFVQDGPFRFMRHPTYFSMGLELASVAVLANAWFSLLIIPLIFGPVLWWRLRLEEAALVEKFGDRYREYQKTTPAIFPFKLGGPHS